MSATPSPAVSLPTFRPAGVPSGNRGKRIGILVVAYNALTTLSSKVLKRIPPDIWDAIEEIAVFDDASPDETYELAVGYKALFGGGKLNIFKNEKNLGYGGNQKRGYQYFLDKGFDVVVMLHGDGQYAPEFLAQLYAPLVAEEADAVFGSRMMPDFGGPIKGGMPLYKYCGNKLLTLYANRLLGMSLTEFHSGYRAYSLHALKKINLAKMTDDFHFDTEIIIKLQHQGFRIREVAIPTYYGGEICYVNGFKYAGNVYRAINRYRATLRGTRTHPEFEEYQDHYPLKESKYSSHYFCQRLCGQNNDVLDVGCGEGYFAALLKQQGNRVVGVDALHQVKNPDAFADYVSADLGRGLRDALPRLGGRQFDVVLLQDVLEHLPHPDYVLQDCQRLLKPGGRVVVSLPNVANITVRLALLLGRFQYTPRGILDRTHVRFYTRATARQLLEGNGFEVVSRKATVMPVEVYFGLPADNVFMKVVNRTLAFFTFLLPGLFGYQNVFVARPKAAAPSAPRKGVAKKAA